MPATRPKILFIDAYDSFSNNITSLLATLLDVDVYVLPIDAAISRDDFHSELRHYEAVVCGPGPGSPETEADVGLMQLLWDLDEHHLLPVLGVCLGFQSLVLAAGGKIRRLRRGLHGMVRTIQMKPQRSELGGEDDIFRGVDNFKATLYHSLCADIGQDSMPDWADEKWAVRSDLAPLAWVEEHRCDVQGPERILMAVKHCRKPFWGVQYHPESVCTEEQGNQVIRNWFDQARRWNALNRVISKSQRNSLARQAVRSSLHQPEEFIGIDHHGGNRVWGKSIFSDSDTTQAFESSRIRLPDGIDVPDVAEILNSQNISHVIFDSANGNQPPPVTGVDVRGRFSILAVDVDECVRIEYRSGEECLTLINSPQCGSRQTLPLPDGKTIWHFLADVHEARRNLFDQFTYGVPDEDETPFLGGFVGFVTYEQGLSDIEVPLPKDRGHHRPDVCIAWVTKSIVLDHQCGIMHVQHLEGDSRWVRSVQSKLQSSEIWHYHRRGQSGSAGHGSETHTFIRKPEPTKYEAKVRMCQEYIAAGESYELCLTDQTRIVRTTKPREDGFSVPPRGRPGTKRPPSEGTNLLRDSSWHLYRALRRRNPAPFASYIRLGGATLVSSSPERLLQYDRSGLCSMKPMKGTVKKSAQPGDGCASTLAEAEAILHTPKEEAENLMIVDLVRHDLHGICGAGKVTVPDLLKVEEYQTVYTMITRVEGQLPQRRDGTRSGGYSGLDVLSASLPPGSMTGAPKKRSCEILQQIEGGKERSLYSGAVGYMCVTGRGDWSVTIRSMFRWDDETESESNENEDKEAWHIGAGGAVTILSTTEGEREEMFVKLARPLSIFAEDV